MDSMTRPAFELAGLTSNVISLARGTSSESSSSSFGTKSTTKKLTPVRLLPVMVTLAPTCPLVGVNDVSAGAGLATVKLALLVAVPPGVVRLIGPLEAPAGTVAVIWLSLLTEKAAVVPLNFTAVAPLRLLPLRVTLVPAGPLVGANDVSVGAGVVVPPELVKW